MQSVFFSFDSKENYEISNSGILARRGGKAIIFGGMHIVNESMALEYNPYPKLIQVVPSDKLRLTQYTHMYTISCFSNNEII